MVQAVPMPGPRGKQQPMYDPNTGNYADPSVWAMPASSPAPPSGIYNGGGPTAQQSNVYSQQGSSAGMPQQSSSNIFSGGSLPTLPGLDGVQAGGGVQIGDMQIQGGNNQQAYGSLLDALAKNYSTQAGLQGSMFGNITNLAGNLGTAGIGAGAQTGVAKIKADADRYSAELQLQGIDKQTAEMLAQEKVRQEGGLSIQNAQNQPALQQLEFKKSLVPMFQEMAKAFMPGGSGTSSMLNQATGSFSPQNEQAAMNSAEAASHRATEEAKRQNALQYSGSGYSVNSPAVMAQNASADAAGAGNQMAAQQQIRNDFGNNRGQMAIQAQNANTNQMAPIISLLSKLFG